MPSKKSDKVKKSLSKKENKKTFSWFVLVGTILVLLSLLIPARTFAPVIKSEIKYQIDKKNNKITEITPVNTDFSIIVPKINASAKVVKDVDPFNSSVYQHALTQGVAHALGTATPDTNGNTFIFAHSAGNWYQANQYNAVFYLLNKLTTNDQVFIYYQNKKYIYLVKELKFVASTDIKFMNQDLSKHQLTLMTCWPPGTTLKRLVIIAELQNVN
ncbi:hypothetical protein SDC9_66915 [bioreactor metagenome]|uniref:Sortase A n=1 Tax=bioreactor metagenome TaxID=1076179 RepID=A0A644XWB9_9ZZZZ